jgi:hypothetical protein
MAAQKPTYDELAASLRAHRAEMRISTDFVFLRNISMARRMSTFVLSETGNPPQDLLFRLDPVGGEAPEHTLWKAQAEQARSEHRFILAVCEVAKRSAPRSEPPAKRPRTLAMGAGKGR